MGSKALELGFKFVPGDSVCVQGTSTRLVVITCVLRLVGSEQVIRRAYEAFSEITQSICSVDEAAVFAWGNQ